MCLIVCRTTTSDNFVFNTKLKYTVRYTHHAKIVPHFNDRIMFHCDSLYCSLSYIVWFKPVFLDFNLYFLFYTW